MTLTTSSPPAKRQRTETAPTRSEIWHCDGSVILQVEDIQFRVHWSVLALHSSLFHDMQDLPQPPGQPTVDECPVIELQDGVEDVTHLLKVLYDPTLLLEKLHPLPVVAALIRLGRKYDFRKLLDAAVAWLTLENPTTLEEYDAKLIQTDEKYVPKHIVNYPGIAFDILTLVRENSIMTALPCAYYCVLNLYGYPLIKLFNGVSRGDGTKAFLAPVDQLQCVVARDKLLKAQLTWGYTLGWVRSWVPAEDCVQPEECTQVRDELLDDYLDTLFLAALDLYPELRLPFCNACRPPNEKAVFEGRKKMWEDLPIFFNLSPWSELKNDV